MENFELDKFLKISSSRHHYIPKFLINGFVNEKGLLFVYDKVKDEILKKQRSPKSIFFEKNRNTIDLTKELKSSILEDYFYQKMDNQTSKTIRYFQTEDIGKIDFKMQDTSVLLFFLISLFWRIPKTDYASENIMENSIIKPDDSELLKQDPTYKKLERAGLFKHHIDEMKSYGKKGTMWHNIHKDAIPMFLIGDYPFLHRTQPNEFRKFCDIDLLFAVSSTRIYSMTNIRMDKITTMNSFCYNAAIIHQSVKYVASADLNILKESIDFYKYLKKSGLIHSNENAFRQE